MNWSVFFKSLPPLLKGSLVNIQIAVVAFSVGIVLAVILALMEKSSHSILRGFAILYNTFFRGTPILIQIFFGYYGLPLFGISLPGIVVVMLVVALNSGAYSSQVVLSGLKSISQEQFQAAKALSMTPFQTYRHIILPQCFRRMFPALANEMINLLKDSSLASVVGVSEIVKVGALIRGRTFETFSVFFGIALIYLLMTGSIMLVTKKTEKWSQKACSV